MGKKLTTIWERLLLFQEKMDKIIECIDSKYCEYHIILPIDIVEFEDVIIIKIDAPGISEENFTVYNEGNLLIIEGVKVDIESPLKGNYLIAERRFGKFKNIIDIPENFDINNIKYYINNGVIWVKIYKK